MVSLKKMKIRSPFKARGKKAGEKVDKAEKVDAGKTEEAVDIAEEQPTVQISPVDNDPIMEDREDTNNTNSLSTSLEEERNQVEEDSSPPAPVREEDEDEDEDDALGVVKRADDESVATEANGAGDDALSTVKEEPSKEEAEDKTSEAADEAADVGAPASLVVKDTHTQSLDEDLTLDATATTLHEEGCASPAHTPAFCGCFGV